MRRYREGGMEEGGGGEEISIPQNYNLDQFLID